MLFYGVSITISASLYFQERDDFNVIEGMVREVKMDWDGFVCVFLYTWSVFIETINSSYETIKFTNEVSSSKINLLDVIVLLNNRKKATVLHAELTDTHQYLLSSSCQPNHIKMLIPIQPCTIRRLCSTFVNF